MGDAVFLGLSYEQVINKYKNTVGAVCLMRLKNWADAEDCFQNTFFKLYRNAPDFNAVLQGGVTGQKQAVVQYNGAVPLGDVYQQQMLVGGFQHQNAFAGVFRFDGGFSGDRTPQCLPQQVAHALDPGGGVYIAHSPLHSTCLQSHIGFAQITDHLPRPHIHGVAVVCQLGFHGSHAQVSLVFDHGVCAQSVDHPDVVVVEKILDFVHGSSFSPGFPGYADWFSALCSRRWLC